MVKKLERFFSPTNFGKGSTLAERLTSARFSLASHKDVVVFFDFMSVPQVGFTPDGTVIPRTAEEDMVFRECLASMSVLYSIFPVIVCDEVPLGVPSCFDSGWCFSELATASLGGQLAVFSPEWAAISRAKLTTWQPGFQTEGDFDLDKLLEAFGTELDRKIFREDTDCTSVRALVRSFLLKSLLVRAIRRRDISMLSLALSFMDLGELLDQPVDHALNTPLHTAIAHGFREGAQMSPNPINLKGLGPGMSPNPIKSIHNAPQAG
jgi:hypothetical protein